MKTVQQHMDDQISALRESIASKRREVASLLDVMGNLPSPLLEQKVPSIYTIGRGIAIRNNNDEVPGLAAKIAGWTDMNADIERTSREVDAITYFRFAMKNGVKVDVDVSYKTKCDRVTVRKMITTQIFVCEGDDVPEGYERVEDND